MIIGFVFRVSALLNFIFCKDESFLTRLLFSTIKNTQLHFGYLKIHTFLMYIDVQRIWQTKKWAEDNLPRTHSWTVPFHFSISLLCGIFDDRFCLKNYKTNFFLVAFNIFFPFFFWSFIFPSLFGIISYHISFLYCIK